ncbi:MAG: hypothetical protein H6821_12035 [Planctomycetaceae bacterium]|nr:hypothetical protein [Planctomycetales bacterium]MCB9874897.1 hypothetical protein [Planctomycetaceae bacterium]MCB9939164.1 hypothetical protein [Planctomycetaceae bacterium]
MDGVRNETFEIPATRGPGRVLWFILAISLAIHVLCLVAGRTWMKEWTWPQEPFHATIEMAGGMIALGVAWMLLSLERLRAGTSYNVWIAAALVGMGILDSLHAMVLVGQTFVWLHSTATLVGGLLFVLVWLPPRWQHHMRWWPWVVMCGALVFGGISLLLPDLMPRMVANKQFTAWAKGINLVGGILLFAAAARLVHTYLRTKNIDDLLFCLHCGLFGAAAIMFEQSQLWDLPWWGWHLLRLMAYGVALWFVVETDLRTAKELRDREVTRARVAALEESAEELAHANRQLQGYVDALSKAKEALERSNADLQQFAYVASHDLQEPLRAVAGYCQLLETRLQDNSDEDVQTFLAHATEGAKRMQALINSLLDYARVESRGKEFSHVDVHDVLNEAMANLSVAIEECAAEVTCDEMPSVLGDRDQLVRLFQNLIGNSIKFRRDEAPRIRVNAQANMNHWHFSVSDNGIGLEQQYADRIFVIFQRLHTRTKYPGTGLGLAITKRIVERHGGRMWVESQPGVGSTFFFTLPRNASH